MNARNRVRLSSFTNSNRLGCLLSCCRDSVAMAAVGPPVFIDRRDFVVDEYVISENCCYVGIRAIVADNDEFIWRQRIA